MAGLTSFAVFLLALLSLSLILGGLAQECYYPNGGVSPNDAPCSQDGGACCPLNWECLSNGFCYLEAEDYYERHSCTDQSWEDEKCPQICTYNGTAAGNEAILLCDENDEASWCCDANTVSFNCCEKDDATIFSAPFATPVAQISSEPSSRGSTASPTTTRGKIARPLAIDRDTPTASTLSSETATSSAFTTTSPTDESSTTSTATLTSITSDSNGQISTIISVSVITTAAPVAASNPESTLPATTTHKRPVPIILGLSIGIPLGLLAVAALLFILHHQRKHAARKLAPKRTNTDVSLADAIVANPYRKPELEARAIAPSELPTSASAVPELPAPTPYPDRDARHSTAASSSISPLSLGVPFERERDPRWSAVSAVSASDQNSSSASPAVAQGLQAVSQQHYGPTNYAGFTERPLSGVSSGQVYQPYRPSLARFGSRSPLSWRGV